jgi:hypothetical protein
MFGNYTMLDLPNCFALGDNGKCSCLKLDRGCLGTQCRFIISAEDLKERKAMLHMRLRKIGKCEQKHIADKYYKGSAPWQA